MSQWVFEVWARVREGVWTRVRARADGCKIDCVGLDGWGGGFLYVGVGAEDGVVIRGCVWRHCDQRGCW